jgi:hypothetical protein
MDEGDGIGFDYWVAMVMSRDCLCGYRTVKMNHYIDSKIFLGL